MMNNIFKKICIVMMVAGFGFQAHAGDRNEAEVAAHINAQNAKFMVAFNSGNSAGMAALYTSDAIFMPNNGPRAVGREAIEAAAASFFTRSFTILGKAILPKLFCPVSGKGFVITSINLFSAI